jgi:hypothetical protein
MKIVSLQDRLYYSEKFTRSDNYRSNLSNPVTLDERSSLSSIIFTALVAIPFSLAAICAYMRFVSPEKKRDYVEQSTDHVCNQIEIEVNYRACSSRIQNLNWTQLAFCQKKVPAFPSRVSARGMTIPIDPERCISLNAILI